MSAGTPRPPACRLGAAQTLRLPAEGRRWLAHAIEHGLPPRYAAEKLADALAFSLRTADSDRPLTREPSFAVPTKLVGVGAFQPALLALRASGRPAGLPLALRLDERTGRVGAFSGYDLLGLVQPKHRWVAPLVGHGLRAVLLQVTGDPDRGHTHGCNVALVGVDEAARAYQRGRRDADSPPHIRCPPAHTSASSARQSSPTAARPRARRRPSFTPTPTPMPTNQIDP